VETVGKRGRGRLVDEAENFETGDLAGIFGGLALGIIEIGRNRDDGAVDGFAEMGCGPIFQLAKDERRNLRGSEGFFTEHHTNDVFARRIDAKRKELQFVLDVYGTPAHQPLHRIDAALRLREEPSPSGLAYNNGPIHIEANHGRAERRSIWTRNANRPASLVVPTSHQAVRRT